MHIKSLLLLVAMPAVILLGAGLMYLAVYAPSLEHNVATQVMVTLAIIALGLGAPYWMLKFGSMKAHLENPEEQELNLKDIPKEEEPLHKANF